MICLESHGRWRMHDIIRHRLPPIYLSRFMLNIMVWMLLILPLLTGCEGLPNVDTTALAQTAVALQTANPFATSSLQDPIQPSPTLEISPFLWVAPSETPLPTDAVEGSLVRASYDIASDWGPGHMHDDFDDPEIGIFSSHEIGTSKSWYGDDGRYHISYEDRGRYVWFWTAVDILDLYVDVVVYNGPDCVDRDSAGLVIRGNQATDEGYIFGITCGGQFHIGFKGGPNPSNAICSIVDQSTWNCSSLTTLHESEYISPGPGAINRIGVLTNSKHLTFYINGHYAYYIHTDDFADFNTTGNVALYLGTFQDMNAEASFEDFNLWSSP
jgi:hypothetical protein